MRIIQQAAAYCSRVVAEARPTKGGAGSNWDTLIKDHLVYLIIDKFSFPSNFGDEKDDFGFYEWLIIVV